MAKLKGNLMSSSERGKQPNDHLNLQTRKILEVFHLSYCGWVISKQPKKIYRCAESHGHIYLWLAVFYPFSLEK